MNCRSYSNPTDLSSFGEDLFKTIQGFSFLGGAANLTKKIIRNVRRLPRRTEAPIQAVTDEEPDSPCPGIDDSLDERWWQEAIRMCLYEIEPPAAAPLPSADRGDRQEIMGLIRQPDAAWVLSDQRFVRHAAFGVCEVLDFDRAEGKMTVRRLQDGEQKLLNLGRGRPSLVVLAPAYASSDQRIQ